MKKTLLFIIILGVILLFPKTEATEIKIPNEAIRIRVIANSNSKEDQTIKSVVRKDLEKSVYTLLKDTTEINIARNIIENKIPVLSKNIKKTLEVNNYNQDFNINFGKNYFPEKEYKGIKYEEGMYESLVVSLGEGKGSNWWCVLFPPLCLMEAKENDNIDDVEYQFFIKKIIDKYLR